MKDINIKSRVIRLLSIKSYTAYELKCRLLREGYPEAVANEGVNYAKTNGYLLNPEDQSRLIENFFKRGMGPQRIRYELSKRFGHSPYTFNSLIQKIITMDREVEKILELTKKLPNEPYKNAQKMARKGFSREAIQAALLNT